MYLPNDVDITSEVQFSYNLYKNELIAPVSEGEVIGLLTAIYNDKVIGQTDLITKTNVPRSGWLYIQSIILAIVSSKQFIVIVVLFFVVLILYIFIIAYLRGRKIKNRKKRYNPK